MADPLDGVDPEVVARFALDKLPFDRSSRRTAALLSLEGVRAVVTGGGGDGLGNATCHRLAEQGARVAVIDVRTELAEATANELEKRWGHDALALVTDVGDPTDTGIGGHTALASAFSRVTIGRCSVPDEVASVIAFLASPAGGYVSGTSVSVGGGMSD